MASVATGGGGGGGDRDNDGNRKPVKPHYRHQETLVTPSKASRRRKSESPESTAAKAAASQGGDAVEKVQQQTNGKKPRLVWIPELHDMFVRVCKNLGKDAVPTKILADMNVDGLTRENVASHLQFYDATTAAELQKYRNNLKAKGQSVSRRGNNGGGKMTPRRQEDFPPQAQPVQQASSSVNPPPPQQGSSLHPQIGHGHLVQALPTLVHQQPHQVMQEPMPQPQLFYPLQQQFQASTEQQKSMIMEEQQAAWMNKQAAAAGPGHNHHEMVAQTTLAGAPASGVKRLPPMQVGQAVNMGGGAGLYSVRVASMRDEQRETHMVMPQQQIPDEAEARQLPAAEPAFAGFANSDGAQEEDESCDIQHFWNPGSGPSMDHDFPPPPIKPI